MGQSSRPFAIPATKSGLCVTTAVLIGRLDTPSTSRTMSSSRRMPRRSRSPTQRPEPSRGSHSRSSRSGLADRPRTSRMRCLEPLEAPPPPQPLPEIDITGSHYQLASPFPLLINLGTYLRKILSLLILAFLYIEVRDIGLFSLFENFYIRSLKPNPASLRPLTPPLGPVPCPPLHQLTSSFILWNILRPFGSNLSPIFCPITPLLVLFGFMMGSGSLLPHHHL